MDFSYMAYYYTALAAVASAVLCIIRNSRTINDVNSSTQMNLTVDGTTHVHPEIQSGKARADMSALFSSVFVAITLFAGSVGYIKQASFLPDEAINSLKWESTPYEREFVTNGRFKDGASVEIKYDLIITLPDGYQLQKLKDYFPTLERLFNDYMKAQLYVITLGATVDRFVYEAYQTKRGEFTEHVRNQVLNGIDPKMGLRSVDGYKSFKSLGLKVDVRRISYTFDPTFLKNIEHKTKAQIELEIATAESKAEQLQYEAMKDKIDTMKEWVEKERKNK